MIRRAWWLLFAAMLIGVAAFAVQGERTSEVYRQWHVILSLGNGFAMVFFMLALVGLFCRYFNQYRPWVRYLSDSSYWIFIFHSIPVVAIALPLHHWSVPAGMTFLVVCSATLIICLLSYHYAVRATAIGALLNGRRYTGVK